MQNQSKKVGIAIPIYNVEKYLKDCLESVINQTYKNLKIVLVDDGSTDSSLKLAKEYALKDNRITIITKENGGQATARNAGIEYFSGKQSSECGWQIEACHTERSEVSIKETIENRFFANAQNDKAECDNVESYSVIASGFSHEAIHNNGRQINAVDCHENSYEFSRNDGVENMRESRNDKNARHCEALKKPKQSIIVDCHEFSYENSRNDNIDGNNVESQIDYLIFLDSDDYLALDCVETCVEKIKGVDIVWFNLEPIVESGQSNFVGEMDVYGYDSERILSREQWMADTKRLEFFWWAWQGMIDFKFLQKIGLKFIDAMHEDHHFGTLLFWQASKICVLPKRFYKYRIRSDSIINVNTKSGVAQSSHLYPLFLAFERDKATMSKYNKYASLFINFLEMEKFSQNLSDKDEFEKMFFPWLLHEARELFLIKKDPWNLKPELREALEKYQHILRAKTLGAGKRIKGQLAYKLGSAIMGAKTPLRILTLPFRLFKIRQKHALEQRILKVIYAANPQLKPPPLECYDDYKKALRYKQHLSYRLGEALLKNPLSFPFKIPLIYKNYKKVES